ncbi:MULTISPECIES: M23 family metallopeptidase [unclassified Beijerinckia]|uniref:M23 family metallopeptidase n=1 Tax=unclassified Beijerinckia TaxID=2638183 RepID=UPI000896A161|nr:MULTISPECIES: M23 family metallopeptidase [unclassified Beijerinckia]MDH7794868.1 murein DD-endopeptidase MepM/ murein hydrolase activator NlpD [Beijerinckia sp. GAS462]SEB78427.1 Murein DD-endopeptidase MepM and murein hydrolase activator NlpD, contain LysM domain [Beijerinckia sp. 28-YEA-48]
MSLRASSLKTSRQKTTKGRRPASRYFITLAHGDDIKCIAIRPWALYLAGGVVPLVALLTIGSAAYSLFHDRMLQALMTRQAEMQSAYEDRLAAMRTHVDRVASRQLLDQDSIENRVQELVARQAQLETRAVVVASLADSAGLEANTSTPLPMGRPAAKNRQANQAIGGGFVQAPAFAPLETRDAPALKALERSLAPQKPRPEPIVEDTTPETLPLRSGKTSDASSAVPLALHLAEITAKLDRVENLQVRSVNQIAVTAQRKTAQLRTALASAGVSLDRFTPARQASAGEPAAVGGPFVPLKSDSNGSPFEREVIRQQDQIILAQRLRQALPFIPLRRPLSSVADVTSPFGARTDPFLGRAAMHTGVDLREPYGAQVVATAAGKVVTAGWNGGYGNMVEIDHGHGVSTRYGHMSAILVSEGQQLTAGTVVGRLGSTGRSTGAHLHYEVRIDDEPVDPTRFLRAGAQFFAQR